MIEVGDIYTRKRIDYEIVKANIRDEILWVYVLVKGAKNKLENIRCFGKKAFEEEFRFKSKKEKK